jgi:hypothetical protein
MRKKNGFREDVGYVWNINGKEWDFAKMWVMYGIYSGKSETESACNVL